MNILKQHYYLNGFQIVSLPQLIIAIIITYATGLGLAASLVDTRIGVVKHGPFPAELIGSVGNHLVQVGHEYGITTGRERRCGWIGIPLLHYSQLLNAYSSINITKSDVLDGLDEINIGKKHKTNGNPLPLGSMTATIEELAQVEIEYESMEGWEKDISKCQSFDELADNAVYTFKMASTNGVLKDLIIFELFKFRNIIMATMSGTINVNVAIFSEISSVLIISMMFVLYIISKSFEKTRN